MSTNSVGHMNWQYSWDVVRALETGRTTSNPRNILREWARMISPKVAAAIDGKGAKTLSFKDAAQQFPDERFPDERSLVEFARMRFAACAAYLVRAVQGSRPQYIAQELACQAMGLSLTTSTSLAVPLVSPAAAAVHDQHIMVLARTVPDCAYVHFSGALQAGAKEPFAALWFFDAAAVEKHALVAAVATQDLDCANNPQAPLGGARDRYTADELGKMVCERLADLAAKVLAYTPAQLEKRSEERMYNEVVATLLARHLVGVGFSMTDGSAVADASSEDKAGMLAVLDRVRRTAAAHQGIGHAAGAALFCVVEARHDGTFHALNQHTLKPEAWVASPARWLCAHDVVQRLKAYEVAKHFSVPEGGVRLGKDPKVAVAVLAQWLADELMSHVSTRGGRVLQGVGWPHGTEAWQELRFGILQRREPGPTCEDEVWASAGMDKPWGTRYKHQLEDGEALRDLDKRVSQLAAEDKAVLVHERTLRLLSAATAVLAARAASSDAGCAGPFWQAVRTLAKYVVQNAPSRISMGIESQLEMGPQGNILRVSVPRKGAHVYAVDVASTGLCWLALHESCLVAGGQPSVTQRTDWLRAAELVLADDLWARTTHGYVGKMVEGVYKATVGRAAAEALSRVVREICIDGVEAACAKDAAIDIARKIEHAVLGVETKL